VTTSDASAAPVTEEDEAGHGSVEPVPALHARPASDGESGESGDGGTPAPGGTAPLATDKVDQLAFLHELAQLATQARDWDELMRTLVDRTTIAMGVEVCSFYLLNRDGERLTLAATNGLDRTQVGRVSLGLGEGITGRAAAGREPVQSADVTVDPRFS
jgi:hypothetical protein